MSASYFVQQYFMKYFCKVSWKLVRNVSEILLKSLTNNLSNLQTWHEIFQKCCGFIFCNITVNLSDRFHRKICNVADFYRVTFAFRKADFYYKIPSIGSQEQNSSPQRSGSLVFLYYLLISFVILFFLREKIMRRTKSATTYCFSASNFSVGPQRLSSHRRPLRYRHDAASNISWRSLPPAGTICRSYVFF